MHALRQLRSLYYMLVLLTLITAALYSALLAYLSHPALVVYLGAGVMLAGLALLATEALSLLRYNQLVLLHWRANEQRCPPRELYERSSNAALWAAFSAVLLVVGLLIEGLVLFLRFAP